MKNQGSKVKVIDVRCAAIRLDCTPSHIYRLVQMGKLRAIKIGERKGIRILVDAIDEMVGQEIDPDTYSR